MRAGAARIKARALHSCAGILLCSLVAASAEPVSAQEPLEAAPPPQQSLPSTSPLREEPAIVITGSRIPRSNLTAVSPVTVIDSQEIKLEGAVLTEALLNTLPQTYPGQG